MTRSHLALDVCMCGDCGTCWVFNRRIQGVSAIIEVVAEFGSKKKLRNKKYRNPIQASLSSLICENEVQER